MTGLYFYKLISPYKEDVTKDCKLTINELDNNFLSLKDMDIKDVEFDEATSVISLIRNNGEVLDADLSVLSDGVTKDLAIDYDSVKGEINIHYNGTNVSIDKLVTLDNIADEILTEVISDGTLIGLGSKKQPLGIAPTHQTGSFKPAIELVDKIKGESLPKPNNLKKGDRYVTKENLNLYGLLYNYSAVKAMAEDLKHGWRIPSKNDWDNMLNAIEPCEFRNHDGAQANKVYGKLAGKFLKSKNLWTKAYNEEEVCSTCDIPSEATEGETDYIEDEVIVKPRPKKINPNGVDSYGMALVPSGYHDDCAVDAYFHDRGYYWTTTQISESDIYIKRFDYNRSGVVQSLASPREYYSIRFVKDYDGSNFKDVEHIHGQNFSCVLIPTLNTPHGFSIWTSVNVDFNDVKYHAKEPNNGLIDETVNVPAFYVNEWDGFKWEKKKLEEGEQIVLLKGLNGDKDIEYMVVDGELVSSAAIIQEKVLEEIGKEIERIDGEIEIIEGRIDTIEEDLGHGTVYEYVYERDEYGNIIYDEDGNPIVKRDEEGNPIIAVDEEGNPIIKEEASGLHKDVEDNAQAIADEIKRAQLAESGLTEDIAALNDALNHEIERAQAAEEALDGRIDGLQASLDTVEASVGLTEDGKFIPNSANTYTSSAETVVNAIDQLDAALKNEEDTRSKEVSDLQDDVKTLDEALKAETEARIEKDDYLEGRLIKTTQSDNAFDCANGVLTLDTEKLENKITIKLSGDFGIIPFKEYD